MWTFMVAVSLNGIRVDANLCDLQNIGLPEDSFLSSFSLSLALSSCLLLPHYFQELYKVNWRIVERFENVKNLMKLFVPSLLPLSLHVHNLLFFVPQALEVI
ncbi:hypothetical protein Taro_031619 [Colocasia esculenta]|uniref:Uncharacterized protein n=1 Tax=Colocasia esculenta TaxID=4460 RepID=A0A843VZI1_COLES|nr:hypothetical protein [Colocasia esculenta]